MTGYYSAASAASCTECENGSMCPTTFSSKKITCPTDYYSADGWTNCIKCPVGASCANTAAEVTINYAAGLACAEGNTCYEALDENGVDAGFYSVSPEPWQIACPEGYDCAADGTKTVCADGEYSHVTDDSCVNKPAGYLMLDNLQQNFVRCPPGTYSAAGWESCRRCPENYECTHNSATKCPDGYYSPYGLGFCLICPAGHKCDQTNDVVEPCESGYYSDQGATACTVCPAGHHCPYPDHQPIECPMGTHATGTGSIYCTPDSEGTHSDLTDFSVHDALVAGEEARFPFFASSSCPAGMYSDATSIADTSILGCAFCAAG